MKFSSVGMVILLKEKEDLILILLVDKNLACSCSEFKTDNLIFYDGKIPYLEILKILRKYEQKQVTEDVEKLKNINITFEGGVINLGEIARKYEVSLDALKMDIKKNDKNGYPVICF